MKKGIVIFAAFSVASFAFAQVKLAITAQGMKDGIASVSHKTTATGGKIVMLSMQFEASTGRKVRLRTESTYAASGAPTRIFHEAITEKPTSRRQVTVTFTKEGAQAVSDESGKRSVKNVGLVSGAPVANSAEFWFLRDKPKPGQKVLYYHFNVSTLEWVLSETAYIGPTDYKLGKSIVKGHRLLTKRGEFIVDEQGLPLKLQMDNVTMTRIAN